MRSAFRGPAHQLAVRMRINNCTHGHYGPSNQPCTSNCTSAEGLHFSAFHFYQECNLSLYCGSLLPMCCYPYLVLYMDICSPFEEDLSCLCVSIQSCKHQSCDSILTILEGGGERCDGEKTVQDIIFLRNSF